MSSYYFVRKSFDRLIYGGGATFATSTIRN